MVTIPNNIILTWKNNNIPENIFQKWRNLNPTYNLIFYTDDDIIKFLDEHYNSEYSVFFKKIPFGRYKADFFRLCYLYK